MCGIAGIHVKDRYIGTLNPNLLDRLTDYLLLSIESRGRDATGLVAVGQGGTDIVFSKEDKPASEFVYRHPIVPDSARTILAHTRFATQGHQRDNNNNHPVKLESCYAIHNGHIDNDIEILNEFGIERPAEVDSIAIPACFQHHGIDTQDQVKSALEELAGSYAIAVIDPVRAPDKLVLAKGNSSPMWILNHPKMVMWASTKDAIEYAWGRCIGTPPTRKAKWCSEWQRNKGEKDQPLGLYELRYGEYWIVEGSQISRGDFKPKYKSYTSHTSYNQEWWDKDDEYDNYGFSSVERRSTTQAHKGGRFQWTCEPNAYECEHKCGRGCLSPHCQCYEGNPNHPTAGGTGVLARVFRAVSGQGPEYAVTPDGIVERVPASAIDKAFNAHNTENSDDPSKIDCFICLDPYDANDLVVIQLRDDKNRLSDETVLVCEDCSSWDKEDAKRQEKVDGNLEHRLAMRELAYEFDTTPTFCDWLLFSTGNIEVEAMEMEQMKESLETAYIKAATIVQKVHYQPGPGDGVICERHGCKTNIRYATRNPHDERLILVCPSCKLARDLWVKEMDDEMKALKAELE